MIPPVNFRSHKALCVLAAAAGFAGCFFAGRKVLVPETSVPNVADTGGASIVQHTAKKPAMTSLPECADLLRFHDTDWLKLSGLMDALTESECERMLETAHLLPEAPRSKTVSLLILQWAQTDPAAAAEWCLSHQGDRLNSAELRDLVAMWASRDGMGLARWWEERGEGDPGWAARPNTACVMHALIAGDPPAAASLVAGLNDSGGLWQRIDFVASLVTPEDVRKAMRSVEGQVAYSAEGKALAAELAISGSAHSPAEKQGWNLLFEATAVALHKTDPAACDLWLTGFQENAQQAARHSIARAEKPDVPPSLPFDRANPAAVPAANESARTCDQWSDWWRAEPQAAEAFLNAAAWPDDLKFRARAKAYSSAP